MTDMKIENYEKPVDIFTLPINSQQFDDPMESNHTTVPQPYDRHSTVVAGKGIAPKLVVFPGYFFGASREANYSDLTERIHDDIRLKKLFFHSDRFYLGVGKSIKKVYAGARPGFIDYVCGFETILGILLGSTEKTSGSNAGTVTTYVTDIVGTVSNGAVDVTLKDDLNNALTIPNASLATSDTIIYKLFAMVNTGGNIYVSEFGYVGISQTVTNSETTTSTSAYHLVDAGGTPNFLTSVEEGDLIHNTTDDTWTSVVAIDGNGSLMLLDDIMTSAETYVVYRQTKTVEQTKGTGKLQIRVGGVIGTIITTNLGSVTTTFRDGYIS